jgi:SAM-dependent methyltransferase
MTFRVADAHALPFPDQTFDRVTSRLGIMYFVELDVALAEVRRVLNPAGRATFLAWGSFEQPFFEALLGGILQQIDVPEPAPGEPHPFMFAEPGSLSGVLTNAGFHEVEEEHARVSTYFNGTVRQYWDWFWELVPPMQPLLDALPPEQLDRVIAETMAALRPYDDGRRVVVPIDVIVASGQR